MNFMGNIKQWISARRSIQAEKTKIKISKIKTMKFDIHGS